jgi:hypothetical protein
MATCPEAGAYLRPYLSSEDLNGEPTCEPARFIADVGSLSEEMLKDCSELYEHLKSTVWPERQRSSERRLREQWWKFSRPAQDLYSHIVKHDRVLAMGRHATYHAFAFQGTQTVFSDALSIFLMDRFSDFAQLQSCVHEIWAKFLGSSIKDDPRYIPEDCFETYPFAEWNENCEAAGRAYYDHRAGLMVERNEGMTKTYNRFHNPEERAVDIVALRDLHAAMDRAVLAAYAWHDLAERSEPRHLTEQDEDDHTYQGRLFWPSDFRDEVLSRLLALNAQRHTEEVGAGLVPGVQGRGAEEDEEEEAGED